VDNGIQQSDQDLSLEARASEGKARYRVEGFFDFLDLHTQTTRPIATFCGIP